MSTNWKMCRLLFIPFVGCRSHRLNLAVKLSLGNPDKVNIGDVDVDDPRLDEEQQEYRRVIVKADRLQRKLRDTANNET